MAFKTKEQRIGFFSSLRNKFNQHNKNKHDEEVTKLKANLEKEKQKLQAQQTRFKGESETRSLKKKIEEVKAAKKEISNIRFKESSLGKVTALAKKGGQNISGNIKRVIDYEKKHAKSQFKTLKKAAKSANKSIKKA
ncbi:unnamed protein product, partial [marine sediment metagenome]